MRAHPPDGGLRVVLRRLHGVAAALGFSRQLIGWNLAVLHGLALVTGIEPVVDAEHHVPAASPLLRDAAQGGLRAGLEAAAVNRDQHRPAGAGVADRLVHVEQQIGGHAGHQCRRGGVDHVARHRGGVEDHVDVAGAGGVRRQRRAAGGDQRDSERAGERHDGGEVLQVVLHVGE